MAAMTKQGYALGILISLAAGFVLGHFFWPLSDAPVQAAIVPPPAATPLPAPAPAPLPVAAEPPAEGKPAEDEFVLKGVFVSAAPGRSLALIANSTGTARLYKPGQKLDEHYSLRSIGEKEVEIERDGNTRTLPLNRGRSEEETDPATETGTSDDTEAFTQWLDENMIQGDTVTAMDKSEAAADKAN